jgi:calcium-dependent protein kinase
MMNQNQTKITSKIKSDDNEILNTSKAAEIKTVKDFIITEGILVKETKADPYDIYDSLKVLGEGAFGKVEKVKHKISKQIRAMKVIHKDQIQLGSEDEQALINEINIVKTLDHPNIMKVFEYYNTDNCLYIISELLSGGELFDKIKDNKFIKEDVCAYLMKQIFSAVDFCHEKKIIHRDLKPENVLIESEEEAKKEFFTVKLIDFGTSDKMKKGQKLNEQVGTPYYTAPEVIKNNYNEKCDLWSCGVIMYLMLCGKQPFEGDNDEEIYDKIRKCNINFLDEEWDIISNDAKDLIKKLLIKDPNKRYSAKESLAHPWIIKNKNIVKIDNDKFAEIVKNLRNYSARLKLQQSTLAYIVHNLVNKDDCDYLRLVFIFLDDNGDGKLTKSELINGLTILLEKSEAEKEVNRLFEIIDVDRNGFIEYEEFLRAGLDKSKILTEDNLDTAFKLYDINKRGKINAKELGNILGSGDDNIEENVWQEMIDEADLDKDGEINFQDFKGIMEQC